MTGGDTIQSLFNTWQNWQNQLAHCDNDKVDECYDRLNSLEKTIIDTPAATAKDVAIKVIVHTNNGDFSLTDEFITFAERHCFITLNTKKRGFKPLFYYISAACISQ